MTARGKHAPDRGRRRIASLKSLREANGLAASSGPRGRGAPVRMPIYHTWLVADFLERCRLFPAARELKRNYSLIGEKWNVTRTAIEKARRKYVVQAQQLVDAGLVSEVNTKQFADAFRKLEDTGAITTGIGKMRKARIT